MENKKRCIDNLGGFSPPQRIGMYDCHGEGGSQVKNNSFRITLLICKADFFCYCLTI